MPERHARGPQRHAQILADDPGGESPVGWMVSYLDMMTLMVALFALLLVSQGATRLRAEPHASGAATVEAASLADDAMAAAVAIATPREAPPEPPRIAPKAIDAATQLAAHTPQRPTVPPTLLAQPRWKPPELGALIARRIVASRKAPTATEAKTPLPIELQNTLTPHSMAEERVAVVLAESPPANSRRLSPTAVAQARRIAEMVEARRDEIRRLPSLEGIEVTRVAEGLNLRIQDRLLFRSASDELTEAGTEVVERLVDILQRYEGTVSVEGHTDSQPIRTSRFPSNWELSTARALAIVHQLRQAGIAIERLRAIGYSDTRPLADNASAEGRARNRRVEVVVHL
ncbi:chemotaxis protein MotB [Halomonas ventosae]|uniref:Chemotaxis protein MotB n=1 Tax=Halomonas ventosae TaxID=229007 RepID=A0A4R6ZV67_9GAMM|nr:OmpA family protein [Halomonas ventosae]TDR56119.1 chemotaxis protein MotB [Halomonas ventosae]